VAAVINFVKPIMNELRANMMRVDLEVVADILASIKERRA